MKARWRGPALALALAFVIAPAWSAGSGRAAGVPQWVENALARPLPAGAEDATAVVLHHERRVVLHPFARHETTTRRVVRVLGKDGAGFARAALPYVRGSAECTWLRTWTLDGRGRVRKTTGLRDAADVAVIGTGELFSDDRMLVAVPEQIRPGECFAFESVVESDPLFAQWSWSPRERIPVAWSRFTLDPSGAVEVVARAFGPDSGTLTREGDRWSWEASGLTAHEHEPLAPESRSWAGGVRVTALPREGGRSGAGLAFRDWGEASRWIAELGSAAATITPVVATRARTLVAGAADTLERIRRLAGYVQGLNYVARPEGIGIGWGYRPHDAEAVLVAGYGDCKDKANLLCALLRAEGVEAWLLIVNAFDRDAVDTAWVSLSQFDHCVTALRVPSTYAGPLLADGPAGPLAVFDPTDPLTVFGDLPLGEQRSRGLLVAPEGGTLVRLPALPRESNVTSRTVEAVLDSSGNLQATLLERSVGQAARAEREFRSGRSDGEYRADIEAWLPVSGSPARVRTISAAEDSASGRFELRVGYEAPAFARVHRAGMITFRTNLVGCRPSWAPPEGPRRAPIVLMPERFEETATLRLPAGYAVDDLPPEIRVESDLGSFEASWVERDGALVQSVRWEIRPLTVGPERWPEVRRLYVARRAAREGAVVLVRGGSPAAH